jgi:hypothetical protein
MVELTDAEKAEVAQAIAAIGDDALLLTRRPNPVIASEAKQSWS